MSHVRQQLRAGLVTALTGLTTTGTSVEAATPWPTWASDLPALRIFTPAEAVETSGLGLARKLRRAITVEIRAKARGLTVANTLDTVCAEVETALVAALVAARPAALAFGAAQDIRLETTEIEIDAAAEQPTGEAVMTWTAYVHCASGSPETAT